MQISNLLRHNVTRVQTQLNITRAAISAGHNQPTHVSNTQPGRLEIDTQHVRVSADYTNFFASAGNMTLAAYLRQAAQKGRQAALEYAGTRTRNGEYLNHIEKGHTIAQLYRQKNLSQANTELDVKLLEPPELTVTPGRTTLNYIPMKIDFTWDIQRAPRHYTPPHASMEVTQQPSVTYDYLGRPRLANPQTAQRMNLLV